MGLSDISGIFSRYFVVGFFLPAFFALAALSIFSTSHLNPPGYQRGTQDGILVLGGAALLVGLLLLGLSYPILRFFEGYPLLARGLRRLRGALVGLQRRTYDGLAATKRLALESTSAEEQYRGVVAWQQLNRGFPGEGRLLPTRFGNAVRAFEDAIYARWRLDGIAVWPRIEPLLSEQEQELHSNARTDVAFFTNSALAAWAVGVTLVADEVAFAPVGIQYGWLYAIPFAVGYLLYRGAIGAAVRWGTEVTASVDLHRLELYDRLGFRAPLGLGDERERIARPLNKFLLFGEDLPDDLWQLPSALSRDGGRRTKQRKEVRA